MGILFKITLSTLVSFVPLYVLAHKVTLEDKSLEKIVNERRCLQVNYVTFKTDWKVK